MSWQEDLKQNVTTVEGLRQYLPISDEEAAQMNEIIERYPMSVSEYYLSLIDPDDPHDPIRKMAVPSPSEMILEGQFDTSGEAHNTVLNGLQHKYAQTAMVLSTNVCAMYCRHCFRKRLVGLSDDETVKMFDDIADYIGHHEEINNVLISGGDAFLNSNRLIEHYLETLSQMDHIEMIRFATRTPVTFPQRINDDPELLAILRQYRQKKQIYVVTHFNHPHELTAEAIAAVTALQNSGITVSNQTVLLKGVNDDPDVLATLMNRLVSVGVLPYYVFQCRPVTSVKNQFQVPLLRGWTVVEQAKAKMNGHAKRFRYCMSHETGKIEMVGLLNGEMVFKYHQAKNADNYGRLFSQPLSKDQAWLGEIELPEIEAPLAEQRSTDNCYEHYAEC